MRINVLGIGFDNVTMEEAVDRGMELIHGEGTHYVVTPNPEIVEVCREWSEVANAVNQADLVLPDGTGILKGAKILGTPLKERTPGIEFAEHLMERMAKEHRSLYLLGAKPHVAELAAERLMARYPGLVVAGVHDGYFRDDAPVVEAIRKSGAEVVFVCTGAPRQELWMAKNGPATGARLLCGLGGSLDIFSGMSNRAPKFWCDHNLEWFYRLCKEPWRFGRMRKLPLFLRHVRQEKKERKRQKKFAAQEARRREQREQREQARIERAQRRERERQEQEEQRAARRQEREERRAVRQQELEAQRAARRQEQESRRQEEENREESFRTAQEERREARRIAREQRQEIRRRKKQAQGPEELNMQESNFQNTDTTSWNAQDVRGAEKAYKRRKRRRMWIRVPAYILLVTILSVLLAECGWLLFSDLCAFNREVQKTATIEVSTTDDVKAVAEKLHEAGLINYKFFFRIFAAFAHAEKKIGAGTYELNTEMDYRALIVGMQNSSGSMSTPTVRVTIPEGYTVRDIIALLARNGVATEEELTEAAQTAQFDYSFIDNNDTHLARLEGYLFPDTYDFYQPERPTSALNKLLSNFERKLDRWEGELAYAETRGYNLNDIVTVASLIEKETDGTDQGRIASVIYHRLEGPGDRGGTYGLLQIDASLLYALPNHTGPITSADLETESAYNLYRNAGLPPTPIANPGAKAIEAALTPESTDYYYYGLAKDNRHRFFATYREFTSFLAGPDYIGN